MEGLTVTGIGSIAIPAEFAEISFKVATDTRNKASTSLQDGKEKLEALITSLQEFVGKDKISTTEFNLVPYYAPKNTDTKKDFSGCGTLSAVRIKVDDLDILGAVVDNLRNVNDLRIGFGVADQEHEEQVREIAIHDARKRAKFYSDKLDVKLGSMVSFEEVSIECSKTNPVLVSASVEMTFSLGESIDADASHYPYPKEATSVPFEWREIDPETN